MYHYLFREAKWDQTVQYNEKPLSFDYKRDYEAVGEKAGYMETGELEVTWTMIEGMGNW